MSHERASGYSQSQVISFFQKLLPAQESNAHDKLVYHQPARRKPIRHFLLSITATEGLYARLSPHTCLFLHRPWDLERHRVPHGCMVVSSHFRFDETLTIGYNPHLAGRLGCPEETLYTLSGYKSDPSRRIGSLGALKQEETLETALDRIATEFELPVLEGTESTSSTIRALALMNAFDEAQVDQVATHFQQAIEMPVLPTQVLYITGQTREAGAGRAAALDMPVVFVGHREAEAWGIRRLAQLLQEAFPDVQVETSFEPEAEKVRQPKKTHEEVEI